MKHLILISFSVIVLSACQKQFDNQSMPANYLGMVKAMLKDSLSAVDYSALDFTDPILTKMNKEAIYLLRIPFKGKNMQTDFVLIKTDAKGEHASGRIVHLERSLSKKYRYDGNVLIKALNRQMLIRSTIENGFITAFHNDDLLTLQREDVVPDPYVELPEVIIVSTYSSNDVFSSTWMSLMSFFDNAGGGGGSYYSNTDASGGSYSGGGGGGGGNPYPGDGGVTVEEPMLVDFESVNDKIEIDIEKYLKCFDNLPDAGASCSIEIFTDIPVDDDPNKIFNWDTESPGHTFIQIKKKNGSNSVVQNIGFYPKTNWKTMLTPAPVDGKFVDNAGHEFNASLLMNVSAENFKNILTKIQYLARFVRYDIDDYNCSDFALQVFNEVRTEKLEIPKYDIPGGMAPYGTNTPQGLYQKLREMKSKNHPEAGNITSDIIKGWVGNSKGSCN